jgi:hypothetical protein
MFANIQNTKIPIYTTIKEYTQPCLIQLNHPKFEYQTTKRQDFKIDQIPTPINSEFIEHENYYESTWEQSDHKFILYRLGRISSTHFAGSAGYDKYKSKLETAYRIFGCEDEFSEEAIRKMSIGTFMEPHVIDSYCKVTNNKITRAGFCISKSDNRIGFSPDGFCNEDGIIECKGVEKLYDSLQNRLLLTEQTDNHDHIPTSHFCQMQGIMHLSNRKVAEYCVGVYNSNYIYYERILYNREFCEKMFSNIHYFMKKEYSHLKNISNKIIQG